VYDGVAVGLRIEFGFEFVDLVVYCDAGRHMDAGLRRS